MPEDVGDLLERGSLPQELASNAMPKDVGPGMSPTTAAVCRLDRGLHHPYSDWFVVGCDVPNEHGAICRERSLRTQVFGDCAAGLHREWQEIGAAALALG